MYWSSCFILGQVTEAAALFWVRCTGAATILGQVYWSSYYSGSGVLVQLLYSGSGVLEQLLYSGSGVLEQLLYSGSGVLE